MRKIILILFTLFLFTSVLNAKEYKAKCIRVVDGDTIVAIIDLGFGIMLEEKIRFLDYDSPEIFKPKSEEERMLGKQAKTFLKNLIEGRNILLKVPPKERGKYGRILAEIYYSNIDVILTMKSKGFIKEVNNEI